MADIGGGGLMDIGCYNISLSRFIFGAEPQRVLGIVEYDPQFATDRLRSNLTARAKAMGKPFDELWQARANAIPAGRFGDAAEFGELCAYICSAQAAYITGQNFLIDGGTYPGTY